MREEAGTLHDRRTERRALVLWTLLARAYHQSLQEIDTALDGHGLTVMEFDFLAHIHADPGLTQQQLAGRLLVTKGNVTYQLTKLGELGLIERRVSGRSNHLHLTERGGQLAQDAIASIKALHIRQFAHLTPEEQGQLAALLRKATGAPRATEGSPTSHAGSPHAPLTEV